MSKSKNKGRVAIACAVLLIALSSATNLFSKRVADGETIVVNPISTDIPGTPRGPVFNPFSAYRINTTVVLASDTSYGLVSVTRIGAPAY